MIRELTPVDLAQWRSDAARPQPLVLDVREPWEYEICHLAESLSMPLSQLPARVSELPKDQPVVVVCHHGARSYHVTSWLQRMGFGDVANLAGGIAAWSSQVDPQMRQY